MFALALVSCGMPPGGGGAGGGTNGGGGGATSTGDNELISGTRLKAVVLTSADGAKAPVGTAFWDSQLSLYCSPDWYSGICAPVAPPSAIPPDVGLFSDSACMTLLADVPADWNQPHPFFFPGAPAIPPMKYLVSSSPDGGVAAYTLGQAFTGQVYVRQATGCVGTTVDNGYAAVTVSPTPASTFASFSASIQQ
jgi:hypothetical protein